MTAAGPPGAARHSPYFFTEPSLLEGGGVVVEGPDARHLAVVRRARPGDLVTVGDGRGRVLEARLTSVGLGRVEGEVLSERRVPRVRPVLAVCQGLARGQKVDLVVQKLVEVGVGEIIVFLAGRSVPRWDEDRAAQAWHRWETIAREAAKQARHAWLPVVRGPVSLTEAAQAAAEAERALVAYEQGASRLRDALPAAAPGRLLLVVGPEGGLEEAEVRAFTAAGAEAVSLGGGILRTETAALVAASMILYHYAALG